MLLFRVLLGGLGLISCGALGLPTAWAQRGVGGDVGVAQLAAKPAVVTLTGTLSAIETGPCEQTTGRALIGAHLILRTADGEELNIHLGPQAAVGQFLRQLATGDEATVQGFRTERMKPGHYVAQTVTVGEATLTLRDESLRPTWAAGPGTGRNPYAAGPMGRGYGRGYGYRGGRRGYGRGMGPACPWRG